MLEIDKKFKWGKMPKSKKPYLCSIDDYPVVVSTTENNAIIADTSDGYFGNLKFLAQEYRGGVWKNVLPLVPALNAGRNFVEHERGLFGLLKTGSEVEVSNATIRIKKVVHLYEKGGCKNFYIIEAKWNGTAETFEVEADKFKSTYQILRRKYSSIYAYLHKPEVVEEYLAKVADRDLPSAPIEEKTVFSGWFKFREGVRFSIGEHEVFRNWRRPAVSHFECASVCSMGVSFLQLGDNGTVGTLFLYSHIAFTQFWFEQGLADMRATLYLRGNTNCLKTSVAAVLSNPFTTNRKLAVMRLGSTEASIKTMMQLMQDVTLCVDDASFSEAAQKGNLNNNIETIVRIVGDGLFPSKMKNGNKFPLQEKYRGAVIVTGEEGLELGHSSTLRIIECPVANGTFDREVLTYFQENPQIMADYFSVYIDFLTERGNFIVELARTKFPEYRSRMSETMKIPRLIDSAAILLLVCDVWAAFARWCGLTEAQCQVIKERFCRDIRNIMAHNAVAAAENRPAERFVRTLFQVTDNYSGTAIADSESEYCAAESRYIGFCQEGRIWINPEKAYDLVCKATANTGRNWLPSLIKMKKMLFFEGYTVGKDGTEGKPAEYLCRAKKGSRKRFLVFLKAKIKEFL